nr:hypothetical protein [Tanacetum cinerariifolium]
KVEPLLVAFDSQLKIFHTSLDDDASCEHHKRDVKGESFLNAIPFHNLEIPDSNDPPLGVYIKSIFSVNSETVELLTFTPPVRDSPKSVHVLVYWILQLAMSYSNHDLKLKVSSAEKTIQDAERIEQWVDHLHLFQTPDMRVRPSER